ncbi:MAG: TRAP transporter small permease [Defluviicoccus sp.]|nr:TRAP transporter small permease [Defluviicoccus sp.]
MSAFLPGRFAALAGRAASRLAWLSAATLASMTLLTFVDVLGRELLSAPITAKVEATELLMGLTVFLAIGLTTFLRGHTRVDIVISHLPPRWQAGFDSVTYAVSLLFVALICWRLGELAAVQRNNGNLTQIWEIPLWPVTVVMVLCSLVMFAALAMQWIRAIRIAAGTAAPDAAHPPSGPGAG